MYLAERRNPVKPFDFGKLAVKNTAHHCRNRVIVSHAENAERGTFSVEDMNWMGFVETAEPFPCEVKVRSAAKRVKAHFMSGEIVLDKPMMGIAPGQSAVCYEENTGIILCGGVISRK